MDKIQEQIEQVFASAQSEERILEFMDQRDGIVKMFRIRRNKPRQVLIVDEDGNEEWIEDPIKEGSPHPHLEL